MRIPFAAFALALACAASQSARGQAAATDAPTAAVVRERYPASSIDSPQKADAALADTVAAKKRVEREFKDSARACQSRILVTSCLDGVREQRRKQMADLDAIELEANRLKRRDRADRLTDERARREADREAKAPADAEARARNREAFETRQAEAAKSAVPRSTRTPKAPAKPTGLSDLKTNDAARAKNVTQFDEKRKAAADHKRDVDRRLAEKTVERKKRADAKAAKDAKQKADDDAKAAAAAATPPPPPTASGAKP